MLQTLQGLEDPRNKAVNPNPMPLPDIFYKVTRDNSCLRSFPTADELCVRETLESNYPQIRLRSRSSSQNFCQFCSLEIVKGNLVTFTMFVGILIISTASTCSFLCLYTFLLQRFLISFARANSTRDFVDLLH